MLSYNCELSHIDVIGDGILANNKDPDKGIQLSLDNTKRAPRAPKLSLAKKILRTASESRLGLHSRYTIPQLSRQILKSDKITYANEYMRLLQLLGLITIGKTGDIRLTEAGLKLSTMFSDSGDLTNNDKRIFSELLLCTPLVNDFLQNVFYRNADNKLLDAPKPRTQGEITDLYLRYKKTASPATAERESRHIYNWLQQVDKIEYDKFSEKFYVIGDEANIEELERELRVVYSEIEKYKSNWVEIPRLRAIVCSKLLISRARFNELFIELLEKGEPTIEVDYGSISNPEVRDYGIRKADKVIYYLKISDKI